MKINKNLAEKYFYNNSKCLLNFNEDIWELGDENIKLNFYKFNEKKEMKEVIKHYLLCKYIYCDANTIKRTLAGINKFWEFIIAKYDYVNSFDDITGMIIKTYFNNLLNHKAIKGSTEYREDGTPYSVTTIIQSTRFIEDLYLQGIKVGLISKNLSFVSEIKYLYETEITANPRIKGKTKTIKTSKKEYDLETIKTIVTRAYKDEDLYVRAMIIMGTQLGPRIKEILSIEEDCITYYNGKPTLLYWTKKTKKGSVLVEKPINELAEQVIKELIQFTQEVREKLNTKKVFVFRKNRKKGIFRNPKQVLDYVESANSINFEYGFISAPNVNRDFMKKFINKNDICDLQGELIEYTSHYNRHFFSYLAWCEDLSIASIKSMLNHESYAMTQVYTQGLEKVKRERFKKILMETEYLVGINSEKKKEGLRGKIFNGKTEKQLEAIVTAMNIQVLSNGVCFHHPAKRDRVEKCAPGCFKCERFATHKCFLVVHQKRVERIKQAMEQSKQNENSLWYEKLREEKEYIEKNYIEPFL